ncbi:hypothetical protein FORC066_1701 [Yersinia enterocolitica]|nr:hypothetical protein FORC065_2790 [Yersinia enterocolitica]UXD28914.1 hypothetical protein FORC066_1701 [Yersinia enterocolitica]
MVFYAWHLIDATVCYLFPDKNMFPDKISCMVICFVSK